MLGHTTNLGLDNNYYRPRPETILQEYLKAVDYLTIDNSHRLQKQVTELTKKQSDLEYTQQKLQVLEHTVTAKDLKIQQINRCMSLW